MNEFAIKIKTCDLIYGEQAVVSQSDIHRVMIASNFEQNAKDRVAKLIVLAKSKITAAEESAKTILAQAEQKALQLTEQWKEEAKLEAVNDSLVWHYEQHQLESALVDQLKGRIRQQMSHVISQWGTEQSTSELLVHRLTALVEKEVDKSVLTLTVSPSEQAEMERVFSELITVEVDENLSAWQAHLSSSCLSVRLDLKAHLEALLSTFQLAEVEKKPDAPVLANENNAKHLQEEKSEQVSVLVNASQSNESDIELGDEYESAAFLMQG